MVQQKSIDNPTRKIEVAGNHIIYTLKADGVEDYVTYNETIYEVLQLGYLYPLRHSRGYLEFMPKHTTSFFLHDLVFAIHLGFVTGE